jgi:hypothetical protein
MMLEKKKVQKKKRLGYYTMERGFDIVGRGLWLYSRKRIVVDREEK